MPKPNPASPLGASQNKTARRVNDPRPDWSQLFILGVLVPVLIVPTIIGILIWRLGWMVIVVLGAALLLFVLISMVRDGLANRRANQYRAPQPENKWNK